MIFSKSILLFAWLLPWGGLASALAAEHPADPQSADANFQPRDYFAEPALERYVHPDPTSTESIETGHMMMHEMHHDGMHPNGEQPGKKEAGHEAHHP